MLVRQGGDGNCKGKSDGKDNSRSLRDDKSQNRDMGHPVLWLVGERGARNANRGGMEENLIYCRGGSLWL